MAAKENFDSCVARNDVIVTARVPAEIKKQATAVLKRIGSTPTELINAAFEYVIEHDALPSDSGAIKTGRRVLTEAQKNKLRQRERIMLIASDGDELEDRPFKELLAEMRLADYEALS